jgi:putative transcriptional regulator
VDVRAWGKEEEDERGRTMSRLTTRLRILRAQRGWSREYLAAKLGKAPRTVRGWEDGSFSPGLDALFQMEELFGVPGSELLEFVEVGTAGAHP